MYQIVKQAVQLCVDQLIIRTGNAFGFGFGYLFFVDEEHKAVNLAACL